MIPFAFAFEYQGTYCHPVIRPFGPSGPRIDIPYPVECSYLSGDTDKLQYEMVQQVGSRAWSSNIKWSRHGFAFTISDQWSLVAENRIRLDRQLKVSKTKGSDISPSIPNGMQLHLAFQISFVALNGWRFFAPANLYDPIQTEAERLKTLSDDRLTFPLIMAYQRDSKLSVCLTRVGLPTFAEPPLRPNKERQYRQKTDVGSLGFSLEPESLSLHCYWPYYEGEKSVSLDSAGSAPSAFYPLDDSGITMPLSYEILLFTAETFADAVLTAFKNAYALVNPKPPPLPFSLRDSINYRMVSLQKTYREWGDNGAGFIFNFNPEEGYDSPATGFGASFNVVEMSDSQEILEYGFTGRQLNAAYVLARSCSGEWLERGRRTVEFFVHHCTSESGWLYSMYHIGKQRPLYTCGDPEGRVMHYLAVSPRPCNYTRSMVEAAFDLLLNYRLHRDLGSSYDHWLVICRRFADFLIQHQNPDGSWYRAYSPDGTPIEGDRWFGEDEAAAKSATAIPISYLIAFAAEEQDGGVKYVEAARRAGLYVLTQNVSADHYQGGTLDNPNVVDKEAALYAMHALLTLYDALKEKSFLDGAHRAAKLAVTWNFIWNAPHIRGTRLDRAGFESMGWGGINSIWGGGVGDIYSLFFLHDFLCLSQLTGETIYASVADLIANGTQQLLSYPGNLMGFADIGMQPEGVSLCNQGVDEGLITKGDIWGSLGWIYTAGIFGMHNYLVAKDL